MRQNKIKQGNNNEKNKKGKRIEKHQNLFFPPGYFLKPAKLNDD
jgi:hypothetical protein